MNQLEQDIINSANVKLAGIAKGVLLSALGGATSGGLAGAGIGSLLGGTIGAVKNYRNSAGTFGTRLKAGLTGGLRGGAKGGLIGGGIGAGLGAISSPLLIDMAAKENTMNALRQLNSAANHGVMSIKSDDKVKELLSYLQGLNENGDNYRFSHVLRAAANNGPFLPQLKRDALSKSRDMLFNSPTHLVGSSFGGLPLLAALTVGDPAHMAKTLFMRN